MLIESISNKLFLPAHYVGNLAAGASYHYKTYAIPKRNGERRWIDHPSKPLKAIQRWLVSNVIVHFPVHPAATAYCAGRNIANNAHLHVRSRYLLRVDLHDFFHSLLGDDVRALFRLARMFLPDHDGWLEEDVEVFISFVCKDEHLTIGAPSSPSLCNALCYQLDVQLTALADANELVYSRYADDPVFSRVAPGRLKDIVSSVQNTLASLQYPKSLGVNGAKTWHASRRGRRKVTGIVLTSDAKLSVGRSLRRQLRSEVYRWSKLDRPSKARLAGLLAYVRGIEPKFINSLILKYGADSVLKAMRPPSDVVTRGGGGP